jgi:hypothetical protein
VERDGGRTTDGRDRLRASGFAAGRGPLHGGGVAYAKRMKEEMLGVPHDLLSPQKLLLPATPPPLEPM